MDNIEIQDGEGAERGEPSRRPEPPSSPESKRQKVKLNRMWISKLTIVLRFALVYVLYHRH